MGRKERRIQKKFEKNPIRELNKVQNRFYSQLFWKFSQTEDPGIQAILLIPTV